MAMLARQGWRRLCEPNSLLAKLLKSLYFHRYNFLSASKGCHPS
ncbi:hypothetical protein LINPERPRIM_LOCUS8912 [Linum perenne]